MYVCNVCCVSFAACYKIFYATIIIFLSKSFINVFLWFQSIQNYILFNINHKTPTGGDWHTQNTSKPKYKRIHIINKLSAAASERFSSFKSVNKSIPLCISSSNECILFNINVHVNNIW